MPSNEDMWWVGNYNRGRMGQENELIALINNLRDRFARKTKVSGSQIISTLWPKYQSDMDFFERPKEKRTVEDFKTWMYGDLRHKASERYVPESKEAWGEFEEWLAAGSER